jgi:hypothetical protein
MTLSKDSLEVPFVKHKDIHAQTMVDDALATSPSHDPASY